MCGAFEPAEDGLSGLHLGFGVRLGFLSLGETQFSRGRRLAWLKLHFRFSFVGLRLVVSAGLANARLILPNVGMRVRHGFMLTDAGMRIRKRPCRRRGRNVFRDSPRQGRANRPVAVGDKGRTAGRGRIADGSHRCSYLLPPLLGRYRPGGMLGGIDVSDAPEVAASPAKIPAGAA